MPYSDRKGSKGEKVDRSWLYETMRKLRGKSSSTGFERKSLENGNQGAHSEREKKRDSCILKDKEIREGGSKKLLLAKKIFPAIISKGKKGTPAHRVRDETAKVLSSLSRETEGEGPAPNLNEPLMKDKVFIDSEKGGASNTKRGKKRGERPPPGQAWGGAESQLKNIFNLHLVGGGLERNSSQRKEKRGGGSRLRVKIDEIN